MTGKGNGQRTPTRHLSPAAPAGSEAASPDALPPTMFKRLRALGDDLPPPPGSACRIISA